MAFFQFALPSAVPTHTVPPSNSTCNNSAQNSRGLNNLFRNRQSSIINIGAYRIGDHSPCLSWHAPVAAILSVRAGLPWEYFCLSIYLFIFDLKLPNDCVSPSPILKLIFCVSWPKAMSLHSPNCSMPTEINYSASYSASALPLSRPKTSSRTSL
jgi:hypothetical protein